MIDPYAAVSVSKSMQDDVTFRTRLVLDDTFAQNVYAAMCDHEFVSTPPVFVWECSWRTAGRHVANLRNQYGDHSENYMTWYCSGIMGLDADDGCETGYVAEGTVTDTVREAFLALGWNIM